MKKILSDWVRPFFQSLLLAASIIFVALFDLKEALTDIISKVGIVDADIPMWLRIALAYGRVPLSIAVVIALWHWIRKTNNDCMINRGNSYHDHYYVSYWFCSKVLGYKSCSLKGVPIPMQIRLVIKEVFEIFKYEEGKHTISKENDKVNVTKGKTFTNTVNLLVSDTYKVSKSQLPRSVRQFSSIQIDRSTNDHVHYYSEQLVNEVTSLIGNLPENVTTINLFMTTNPANTYYISKEALPTYGRGRIKQVYLYSQSSEGVRYFEDKPVPLLWPGCSWYLRRVEGWLALDRKGTKIKSKKGTAKGKRKPSG